MEEDQAKQDWRDAGEHYRAGRYEEALIILDRLDRTYPDTPMILYERAQCCLHLDRLYEVRLVVGRLQKLAHESDDPTTRETARVRHDELAARLDKASAAAHAHHEVSTEPKREGISWPLLGSGVVILLALVGFLGYRVTNRPVGNEVAGITPPVSPATVAEAEPDPAADTGEGESGESEGESEGQDNFDESIPETKALMLALLRDNDLSVNGYVALTEQVRLEDLPVLHDILRSRAGDGTRRRAARLCAHLAMRASVEPLLTALRTDKYWRVRRNAAYGLGRIGLREQTEQPLIRAMIRDRSPEVRIAAAGALDELLGAAALNHFERALGMEKHKRVQITLRWLMDTQFKGTVRPTVMPGEVVYGSLEGTLYAVYTPLAYRPSGDPLKVLVSVHGPLGQPLDFIEPCQEAADLQKLIIVAPWFDPVNYGQYESLNIGFSRPRADKKLFAILDQVSTIYNVDLSRFYLYGKSRGALFGHRLALAYPDRIERAVLAEPDFYVPPNPKKHFPYGTRQINFAPDIGDVDFGAFVETPVAFVVGEKGDRTDLPEAEDYLRVLQSYAAEHRLTCRAELITVKDNGTSNETNFNAARPFLFGGAL